jgi:hypothetical protein
MSLKTRHAARDRRRFGKVSHPDLS